MLQKSSIKRVLHTMTTQEMRPKKLIETANPNAFLKIYVEEGFLQNNEKRTGDVRSHLKTTLAEHF